MKEAIFRLRELKGNFTQMSGLHIKVGLINYWPSPVTICIDRNKGFRKNGFDFLMEVLRSKGHARGVIVALFFGIVSLLCRCYNGKQLYVLTSKRVNQIPMSMKLMSMKLMSEVKADLGYSCAGFGRPRPSAPTSVVALVSTRIPVGLDSQLRALAQRDDVSISKIIRRALEKEVAILA